MPSGLIFIVVMIAIVWLLLIRPQRQRQLKQQRMVSALEVGDEVVTAGGIYGRIEALEDEVAHVRVAPEVTLRLARRAIASVVKDESEQLVAPAEEPEPETGEGERG
jgi:preprotein translocase subunit YajC